MKIVLRNDEYVVYRLSNGSILTGVDGIVLENAGLSYDYVWNAEHNSVLGYNVRYGHVKISIPGNQGGVGSALNPVAVLGPVVTYVPAALGAPPSYPIKSTVWRYIITLAGGNYIFRNEWRSNMFMPWSGVTIGTHPESEGLAGPFGSLYDQNPSTFTTMGIPEREINLVIPT